MLAKGGRFLEAPVSGSKGPAANGQLIFLAGGDKALYDMVTPELDAMGKKSFHFGEVGAGTKMKLVVNMVMGTMMCAFGEGLHLCTEQGLDASQLLEVRAAGRSRPRRPPERPTCRPSRLQPSAAPPAAALASIAPGVSPAQPVAAQVLELGAIANPMFKLKGPKMLQGDHAPNFPLQHAHKDMRLAVAAGEAVGLGMPVSAAAESAMKRARDEGHGELDFSAVYEGQKKAK